MTNTYLRTAYYTGIGTLVIYALPKSDLITKYLTPIFEYEFAGFPVISIIALFVGVCTILAVKRKLG